MFSLEQRYILNESKMHTSMILLFITIFSLVFLFFMLDLSNSIVQVAAVLLIVLEMFFMYHQHTLNRKQDKLLKEIEAN